MEEEKREKEVELTPRQKKLYQFLKARASSDQWTSQLTLYLYMVAYEELRYPYVEDESKFHDSKARHEMTKDLRALKKSKEVEKVILCTSRGIKIANDEEWKKYKENEWKSILKRISLYRTLERKAKLDGQGKVFGKNEDDYFKSFAEQKQ